MKKVLLGAFLVVLVAAAPARAQGGRQVHLNLGGGFTMPVADISDRFTTGGGFNVGVLFEPPAAPMLGIQIEYGFNSLSGQDVEIPLQATPTGLANGRALIESHHDMQFVNFNGLLKTPGDSLMGAYAIGGTGMYYRSVSLTTPDVGFTTYCDPYWYVCYPAAVEIDRVVGDRATWDAGVNLGGGVTFKLGEEALFYVETRWHYTWGPEFTDAEGAERNANGQYMPVTFGFRF
jgi:opacity protein-like surface antigen